MRKPYFWTARNAWFVKSQGKNIRLHEDEQKAFDIWEEMRRLDVSSGPLSTFATLSEKFLDDYKPKVSHGQYSRSVTILSEFSAHIGLGTLSRDVKPSQVQSWVRSRGLSDWSNRAAIQTIKQVYTWAIGDKRITVSPIAKMSLPEGEYRDTTISASQHEAMVKDCLSRPESRPFALFLIALRHSGGRQQCVRTVTRKECIGDTWSFKRHKTAKKTGKNLTVHLSGCLSTITKILTEVRPNGPIFRNSNGDPWKKDSVCQRFSRLVERCKLPKEITAHCYRHSLATDLLTKGTGIAQVAEILGHRDTRMVSKVYGHLDQQGSHLRDELRKRFDSQMLEDGQ